MLAYAIVMISIPLRYGKKKFLADPVVNDNEKQAYKDQKGQLMTLAEIL